MRIRLIPSLAALALLAGSPALAEHHDRDNSGSSGTHPVTAGGSSGGTHHDVHAGGTPHTFGGPTGTGTMSGTSGHTGWSENTAGGSNSGGTMGTTHHVRHDEGTAGAMGQGGLDRRSHDGVNVFTPRVHHGLQGIHQHNSAFDSLRRTFNAPRRFHNGAYYRPHGWYSHRWRYGEFLPFFFFTNNYWINDWDYFGLDDPPPGCVWVRYGDDALLIDRDTGEVIQVVYGIFY
jgi:Ni/Co efflux regulator RcnB